MEQTQKKNYFDELNVFRGLVIVWVVLGHSYDPTCAIGFLHTYGYSFHMSAFFMLSGMLFYPKISRIKTFSNAAGTIWGRFKRLMVPYFVYSVITYILKLLFQDYANNEISENIVTDVLLGVNNPNGGLWFLHLLFIISVLAVILCKVPAWITFAGSAVLKVCSLVFDFDIPVITNIFDYSFYFFAGLLLFKYYGDIRSYLYKFIDRKNGKAGITLVSAVLLACSFLLVYFTYQLDFYRYISVAVTLFGIITWYAVSLAVCSFKLPKKAAMVIGSYGMDIYVLGYFVQIPIRVVLGSMLGAPYYLYTTLMFVLGLLLPIPVSKYIIRKVGVFRALFLGDFSKKKNTQNKPGKLYE